MGLGPSELSKYGLVIPISEYVVAFSLGMVMIQ